MRGRLCLPRAPPTIVKCPRTLSNGPKPFGSGMDAPGRVERLSDPKGFVRIRKVLTLELDLDPAPIARRLKHRVYHSLSAHPIEERGHAGPLVQDRVDELDIL